MGDVNRNQRTGAERNSQPDEGHPDQRGADKRFGPDRGCFSGKACYHLPKPGEYRHRQGKAGDDGGDGGANSIGGQYAGAQLTTQAIAGFQPEGENQRKERGHTCHLQGQGIHRIHRAIP